MTTVPTTVVHHVDPVNVVSRISDFYRTLYGETAGARFGMTADFSARADNYEQVFRTAQQNGTTTDYPGLLELRTAGNGVPGGLVEHAGPHTTYSLNYEAVVTKIWENYEAGKFNDPAGAKATALAQMDYLRTQTVAALESGRLPLYLSDTSSVVNLYSAVGPDNIRALDSITRSTFQEIVAGMPGEKPVVNWPAAKPGLMGTELTALANLMTERGWTSADVARFVELADEAVASRVASGAQSDAFAKMGVVNRAIIGEQLAAQPGSNAWMEQRAANRLLKYRSAQPSRSPQAT